MHFIHYQTIRTRNSVWNNHVTLYHLGLTGIFLCTRHWIRFYKTMCSASKCDDSTGDQAHLQREQLTYDEQVEDKEKTRNKQVHNLTFYMGNTLPFSKLTTSYISGSFGFITLASTTFCMGIQKRPRNI